jgi:hypothetical protein
MGMTSHTGRFLAMTLGLLIAGCSSSGPRPAGIALPDAQTREARIFARRCSTCHDTPHPARHDYPGWQQLVGLMEQRMAERGIPALTGDERTAILAYLREHAR